MYGPRAKDPEQATFEQEGVYQLALTVSDGTLSASATVAVTVAHVNQAPLLGSIDGKPVSDPTALEFAVDEGQPLAFTVAAGDADGGEVTFTATASDGSPLAGDVAIGSQSGVFAWTPTFEDAGDHTVRLTVTDEEGGKGEVSVVIHVRNVNRAPILAPIGAKTVNEHELLSFAVAASDGDTATLTLTGQLVGESGLPEGATLADGAGGLAFAWTPTFAQAGTYTVRFTASDGELSVFEDVEITVVNVNRAPILEAVAAQVLASGTPSSTVVTANDPDGDALTCTATGLPEGATFDAATKTVDWTPSLDQSGAFTVVVSCSDGALAGETTLAYEVAKKEIERPGAAVVSGCDCSGAGDSSVLALVLAVLGLRRRRGVARAGR